MKLVIDANILIAATIKNSAVRKIILESGHRFFAPEDINFRQKILKIKTNNKLQVCTLF